MQPAGQLKIKMKRWGARIPLWVLGDIHLLNRGCHETLLDETIAQIADDPLALWFGMGDYADLISTTDKRFDPEMIGERVSVKQLGKLGPTAKALILEKFLPIADKCVGMLQGNHEWSYAQHFEQAIVQDVVEELNEYLDGKWRIPYMHYSGFRDLIFHRGRHSRRFRICAHHGAGYAATKGGKLNRLLRFMAGFDADMYFMGHVHAVTDDTVIVVGADDACRHLIQSQTKVGCITGTFLRTYVEGTSGYGERKLYDPTPLGAPRIWIEPSSEKRPFSVEKPW